MKRLGLRTIVSTTVMIVSGLPATIAWADSIIPASDGTGTQVTPVGNDHTITGGTTSGDNQNLFHSFTEFNLNPGESATFITDPAILNILSRVNGGNASIIDGLLQVSGSNANLFLINPNGILFGPNAALNLQGSFTAATADQVNFATGAFGAVGSPNYTALVGDPQNFRFTLDNPGSVVNAGTLNVRPGESVVLVGGQVLTTGTITAPGGDVIISAVEGGTLVRIAQEGLLLNLEVETLAETPTNGLPFSPLTLPELLTGNAIAQATDVTVNPDGTITLNGSSTRVPVDHGTTLASSTLDVTSLNQGGQVIILGHHVGLLNADINASGDLGGGTIRVGGDYQGVGALPTAAATFVEGTSTLVADAIAQGDGGTIILWSNEATRSYGRLSARGGANSGNGGLIETSSQGYLDTQGVPDISAPNGLAGTWLLDPFDVQIIVDGETDGSAFPTGNPFIAQAGEPAIVSWFDIESTLSSGTGATVTVSTGTEGSANGDITVESFDLTSAFPGSTLELLAAGDIIVPDGLISSVAVNYDFQADTDNSGDGQIRIGSFFSTDGGNISLTGASSEGAAIEATGLIGSGGGNITLLSNNADIDVARVDAGGGDIVIRTPSFVRVTGSPSLETLDGASILVEHGGNGTLPFTVGDAGTNGTFAPNITNGVDTVPTGDYLTTVTFGTIEIRTDVAEPNTDPANPDNGQDSSVIDDPSNSDDPSANDPSNSNNLECLDGCDALLPPDDFSDDNFSREDNFGDDPAFQDERGNDVDFDDDFGNEEFDGRDGSGEEGFGEDRFEDWGDRGGREDVEDRENGENREDQRETGEEDVERTVGRDRRDQEYRDDFRELSDDDWALEDNVYGEDFVSFFNLPINPEPNFESSQNTLQDLTTQVGTPPALVYARFIPQETPVAQHASPKQLSNPQPTDVLQLVLVTPNGQPQQITVPEATRDRVIDTVRRLHIELTDRTRRRQTTYLRYSQTLYEWLITPLEAELQAVGIGHVSFIMSPGLRSLPLAALHDGEQFIIEKYTVGLMPSLALTDTRYTDLRQAPVLAMGASEFTDQPDLPAVPFELSTIVGQLRGGEQTLNETFTPLSLISRRQASEYRILHLATHGEFRSGGPENSYIQFWDSRLSLSQIRELQLSDPPLELLVMSACRTALGDTSAELGFAGLAVQAGVKSALASLWQVSDLETAGLMTEFYTQLNQRPYKAEALRQAQLAMLRGEVTVEDGILQWNGGAQPLPEELTNLRFGNTRHPYYWAAFTLVGSPW